MVAVWNTGEGNGEMEGTDLMGEGISITYRLRYGQ